MSRQPRLLVGALAIGCCLALTACGSDGSEPVAGPPAETTAAPEEPTAEAPSGTIDFCAVITAEEVGAIAGAPVTVEEIIGGGCRFPQEDDRALALSIVPAPYTEDNGGIEAAKFGTAAVIDGQVDDLQIGDGAFIVVGTALGGENQQGQGAVRVDGQLLTIAGAQGNGMSAEDVGASVVALMQLAVSKA